MSRPHVLVCRGKSCGEHGKARTKLLGSLEESAHVELVRCQKICSGPVVGVWLDDGWEWFRRVRRAKARRALARLLDDGKIAGRLERRRVRKRRCKRR